MDKDFQLFDPARAAERLIEPELLAMQRVARDLERERDTALTELGGLRKFLYNLQGYIDWAHENALRVQKSAEVAGEQRDVALAREAVLRDLVRRLRPRGAAPESYLAGISYADQLAAKVDAALATPSPAAEALLELASAAQDKWEEGWLNWEHGCSDRLGEDWERLHNAVEKWQQVRKGSWE